MKQYEFLKLVDKAVKELTPKGQELLKEVVFDVEKRSNQLPNTSSGYILASFNGSKKGEPKFYPAKITLFQEDIEFCNRNSSEKDMIHHITEIIAHELMHYLGANELYASLFQKNMIKHFNIDPFKKKKPWWKI